MKKITTIVMSALMMIGMIGCGSSDSIVGRWKAEGQNIYVQFNDDGTCHIENSGTYQVIDEDTITYKRDGYDYIDEYEYSLDGDILEFEGIKFERQ